VEPELDDEIREGRRQPREDERLFLAEGARLIAYKVARDTPRRWSPASAGSPL